MRDFCIINQISILENYITTQEFQKNRAMKKTIISPEQLTEINFLADWCIEIYRFENTIEPDSDIEEWINKLTKAKKKKKLRGLKEEYNETLEMVQYFSAAQYKNLDKILRDKFGHSLFEADKKYVKRINKIVEKGKISKEEQYYLMREYFERIWNMPEHKQTVQKIEKMLFAFENKTLA